MKKVCMSPPSFFPLFRFRRSLIYKFPKPSAPFSGAPIAFLPFSFSPAPKNSKWEILSQNTVPPKALLFGPPSPFPVLPFSKKVIGEVCRFSMVVSFFPYKGLHVFFFFLGSSPFSLVLHPPFSCCFLLLFFSL